MGKKIIRRVAGASTDANERTINSDDFSRRARASEIDRLVRNVRPVVDTLTVTVSHALPAAASLSLSAWRLEESDAEPKKKVTSKTYAYIVVAVANLARSENPRNFWS
jgi:hypothetical protein